MNEFVRLCPQAASEHAHSIDALVWSFTGMMTIFVVPVFDVRAVVFALIASGRSHVLEIYLRVEVRPHVVCKHNAARHQQVACL